MVTPVVKRQAVAHLCQSYEVSQRRACQVIAADRTSMRYRSVRPDDAVLRARLRELAAIRRRFGYSQANKGFDAQSRADASIKFDKFYLNGLAEYGVSDTITLFVAPEYVVADSSWSGATPTRASNFALEGGARVRLTDAFGIVSLQGSFKSAGPFDLSNSVGHDSARIAELRLLDGFNFKLFGDDGFADIEIAERWISHPRPNETAFDATAGLWLGTDTLLMAQSFNTISGGDALPPYSYYRTHKVELSVVENLSARWSVQLGLFVSPAGQNSLVEQGVTASLWTRF